MPHQTSSTGRFLGWLYVSGLASLVLVAILRGGDWNTRQDVIFGGSLLLFFSGGFALARYFHHRSPVFRLFYRFGRFQTSAGSLRERLWMNCCILAMLGSLLVLLGLFAL